MSAKFADVAPLGAPLLTRAQDGAVLHLTLNRPQQYNALSHEMLGALREAFSQIGADASIRVVVLGGAGKAFCAGHDLREIRDNPRLEYHQRLFSECAQLMAQLRALPQPVIARVHGIATAAGCQLVASCDLAVASTEARFATSGINIGLFCATPAVALTRNVAQKPAFEMLFTGEFIDAQSARERGLVNRVAPPERLDEEIGRLAASILAKPARIVAAGKELFYRQQQMGVEAAYQLAAQAMACNLQEAATLEGIDAFLNKRRPRWEGTGS
ncbi:MAG TPA: enoyl-CoA hydratase [Burkholderiaceae bacterium]|nr:enoyl-CoA hydratase [Burkholderiaceae bacterium]